MAVNFRALLGNLNETTRGALEQAAAFCMSQSHYETEVEHYLMKLLDASDTDAAVIFRQFGVDTSRMSA